MTRALLLFAVLGLGMVGCTPEAQDSSTGSGGDTEVVSLVVSGMT
ncbi:MAG: hypothetical protein AAF517_12010 [Planctomycetota bacterium]